MMLDSCLAIDARVMPALTDALQRYAAGQAVAPLYTPRPLSTSSATRTAVLPLQGMIEPKGGLLLWLLGGTPLDGFQRALRLAAADRGVDKIILDVDSPGGGVGLVEETADLVAGVARRKPVIAVANTLAASAAYWIASAASEIIATPSAEIGSIGVLGMHEDISQARERSGVRVTLIPSDPRKVEGSPFLPLSPEARGQIQKRVDEFDRMFTSRVATGRGVTAARVRSEFGGGRIFGAAEAVRLKMADRIGTLENVLGVPTTPGTPLEVFRRRLALAARETPEIRGDSPPISYQLEIRRRRLALAERP